VEFLKRDQSELWSRFGGHVRRLYSWLLGRKIGEARYVKANPYMIGNIEHILPVPLWTDEMKSQLKFRYKKFLWTGFTWNYMGIVEIRNLF
jgi:hypothetical protein